MFAIGYFLAWLRKKSDVILYKVMYSMLSGWLIFTFFRDPFSVSIVKNMFEFSVLIPFVVIASMHRLTGFFTRGMVRH